MKLILTLILLALLFGCTWVYIPGKLTVVSVLRNIDFDEAYIDPNGVMWLVNYDGNVVKGKFSPLTGNLSIGD